MKNSLVVGACLLLAGPGSLRAGSVELSGFACLFGEKMALLALYPAAPAASVNFTLSEGQAQYGIKLVQVDTAGRRVEIEQDGVKEFISLCGSPVLSGHAPDPALPDGAGPPLDSKTLSAFLTGNDEVERIKAGNPVVNFSGAGTKAGSDQSPDKSDNSGNSTGQSSTASAATAVDHSKEVWYQESLSIEQSRIATAEDVLAGNATPWPRTPLTPANTPAQLIGKETFFPNHIPGYVIPGYTESLAAQ